MNDELKAAAEICPGVTVSRLREALAAYKDGWDTNGDEGVVVDAARDYLARLAADAAERIERAKPIDDEQVKVAAERRTKYLQWLASDGGDDTEFDWYEGAMAELDKQILSAWAIARLAVEAKP
jgi:hypothetical protein